MVFTFSPTMNSLFFFFSKEILNVIGNIILYHFLIQETNRWELELIELAWDAYLGFIEKRIAQHDTESKSSERLY